jgi:hypothetical protein
MTAAAGGAAGNATKAGNMTAAAGGAAGNATKAASNATSTNSSSNPLAKIGQALSGLFGGKK